ncbi:MAG: bifunctional hydroxymethylpyrimidine kinase/phosphomethylpyrimidine kinase [Deltaproteobacteria bacterium]|nr:bifunctional hydroxymethylpyrimidine kinase/phosphomethylpyrimidine kinase [Deltaproteobacteria bacterium]
MKTVLTMAGSDPSGWAGVQADILTFSFFGTRGLSAITAITAQTEKGVKAIYPVQPRLLKRQVSALLDECRPDAVKIGMLGTVENAGAIKALIQKWRLENVVLDPVLRSTGGYPLVGRKGMEAIKKLLPLVTVVTPNTQEASVLSGINVNSVKDITEAAKVIRSLGCRYVLVKGGHLKGPPVDVLYDGKRFRYFKGRRIQGKPEEFHGTGCLLSSAVAAGLANGKNVERAVKDAKGYVREILRKRR